MHILIMGQHLAPEEISGAVLATELAWGLIKRGHHVTFVTSTPSYPYGRPFRGYSNKLFYREILEGIDVIRVWSYISPKKTIVQRLINYTTFSLASLLGGLVSKKPDVILSFSPPLPLGFSAFLLSKKWNVPWILRVEDLFPDLLLSMGIIQKSWITDILFCMERYLYKKASRVAVISEGFKINLVGKGINEDKVSIIPVWADPAQITPMEKENALSETFDIKGRFVILYSGNLGMTSSLGDLLAAAKFLEYRQDILFLIAGEGLQKKALIQIAEKLHLGNVEFIPYQPRQRYAELLALADIGIVTLNKASSKNSLPGKTFNIMASGRPILAITDVESELGKVIRQFDCGVVIPEGQPQELADKIVSLLNAPDKLSIMGRKGREAVEQYYNLNRCIDLFEQLFFE
jgi:colanic acid biosynthesis glycosyl transferase WcaI